MQHFTDQAQKNGVVLLTAGPCQFCGAAYENGVFECMENYNEGLAALDFADARHHETRFLSVDSHALQHPEIHGRWSNHFHLTRLHLMLEKEVKWNYATSPLLSNYLAAYKFARPDERLIIPNASERGRLTSKDLHGCKTADDCTRLIRQWAVEVYDAWRMNHEAAAQIADGFLASIGGVGNAE